MSYSNNTREMMQANKHMAQAEQEMALLYRKYAPGLLTYVRMRVPSAEDGEGLVVEVFLAAMDHAKFAALSEKEKQLWLWRVTRNKVIDAYRRAKTHQSVTLEHVAEGLFEDEMFSPEYAALRQEDYMDLNAHLQSLPPLQQQILPLRFGQVLSCSAIATPLENQQKQNSRMGRWRAQGPQRPRRTSLVQRLGMLAAAVFLVALVGSLAVVFYAVRHNNGGAASSNSTPVISTARVPLKVTSVTMSVTPGSIAGVSCGTNLTVTYTALFHVRPNSVGGTVQFAYTVNNGR